MTCDVDSKPSVKKVKWTRNGRYIDTNFKHTIPRVTLQDSGSYVCEADNGLGQVGKAELTLDVLHAPIVNLPASREVKANQDVSIECNIQANPRPSNIQWFKEGDEKFQQTGPTLRLIGVSAKDNGKYICSASNYLHPTGKAKSLRSGNATIDINVRHKPGKAFITPDRPVAVDGRSITLKCDAKAPGFPRPQYRWWREGQESRTLSVGSEYTIKTVKLSTAGKYFCLPSNELGEGSIASVNVVVYQAPKIITQLQPNIMKRSGDTGFHITCSAVGKPKPQIKWFKDGLEIVGAESELYEMSTSEQESFPNAAYKVLSTLKFAGKERIGANQLMSTDRGHYTCQFENEVSRTETTMLLRIEHSPDVVHRHNKVAFDLGETAYITCRMQAFPSPRFDWSFKNSIIQADRNTYDTNMTALGDDVYEGVLKINQVSQSSYGDYKCKGTNTMGAKRTLIHLQPKGKPERPLNIRSVLKLSDVITLAWDEGFDGGYANTMFTIQYMAHGEPGPRYQDCRHHNPCNITGLKQHTQYHVKVKASNIMGESKFSKEKTVMTKVDVALIPKADNLHYATVSKKARFYVLDNPLPLVAKIELENPDGTWSHYEEYAMDGNNEGEVGIDVKDAINNLRLRFCLETNDALCGPYADAKIVDVMPSISSTGSTAPWLIALIIVLLVVAIMIAILIVKCCCCKTTQQRKKKNKNRPDIVHATQPNYTGSYGIENKGVDTVKDNNEDIKNNIYSVQNGYDYNGTHSYPEQSNSNSNSANGGSVNSQDSLWNVKGQGVPDPHHYMNGYSQHPGDYPYDPMQQQHLLQQQQQQQQQQQMAEQQQQHHQQQEDYAHYPYPDEYLNERNQQFVMDDHYGQLANRLSQNMQHHMEGDCKHQTYIFINFFSMKSPFKALGN